MKTVGLWRNLWILFPFPPNLLKLGLPLKGGRLQVQAASFLATAQLASYACLWFNWTRARNMPQIHCARIHIGRRKHIFTKDAN